jgi:hypothetical protein
MDPVLTIRRGQGRRCKGYGAARRYDHKLFDPDQKNGASQNRHRQVRRVVRLKV